MRRAFSKTCTAFAGLVVPLAGCGLISERLDALPTTRVAAMPVNQPCDAPRETERRLTGAYLRQSDASGLTFVPVLVNGRENRNGLAGEITLNDRTQTQEVLDARGTIFIGPETAMAQARSGFGPADVLPNVYDVTYSISDAGFSGPMVVGPGARANEIPSSGAQQFTGRVALELITQDDAGAAQQVRATGRFAMQAGYGSGRAQFTAGGFDVDLSFDTLTWSGLLLCGTRFVSDGSGTVEVQRDGKTGLQPFKTDRAPAPLTALFESSQFPPESRPAPPVGIGGVFVVQSDNGTLTGVFLSDQPAVAARPEGDDA